MRTQIQSELEKYKLSLPILKELDSYLRTDGKLHGKRIGWHCHLTEITAAAVEVIVNAGAQISLCECNPDTTSSAAVDYMRQLGVQVFLGDGSCEKVLDREPVVISDTGLVLTRAYSESAKNFCFAASEITTSGITVLGETASVPLPVININGGFLKSYIENFHGVGDGVVDGLYQLTARIWSGRKACVVGYGKVGAGVAHYLRRAGAVVIVVESDPVKQLIAHYDGYVIADLTEAINQTELVVTATGRPGLLSREQWGLMCDGACVVNVGHWSTEIDVPSLHAVAKEVRDVKPHLQEFVLMGGKRIYLVAGGSPANVVLLSGSPEPTLIHLTTEILCMNYLLRLHENGHSLPSGELPLPAEVEHQAAVLALRALKIID